MHLALLGDSIFDNQAYVKPGCAVEHHLTRYLPPAWSVSLLAVDGSVALNVPDQMKRLPAGVTHIALSVGGNDALEAIPTLETPTHSVLAGLHVLHGIQSAFEHTYSHLLRDLMALQLPLVVCTIYDKVPGRSDAVKSPTPAMLRAMATAELSDDQYGEDPTTNRLQARSA
ncbi:MAG: beta-eliminating lyase-related protein [Rhodoferax sp.]